MDFVKYTVENQVGLLVISRPKALNALNDQVIRELDAVLDAVDVNEVRCIVVTGEGEKAFVAIALYFAILKVRPTPFCMLDEIDAALDDRNVERFSSYLRNLSEKTQFIVITHRRGTMEASDVLYGVTMQEHGISKLLRLDLNQIGEQLGIME